jgi:soluble lytic murein transglycosylase
LRFLDQPAKAIPHFERILKASETPITQARANYWLGRAHGAVGGAKFFAAAARHGGAYYGQLAAQALGRTRLEISDPKPGPAERETFARRELVRAIAALEAAGHANRADILYRELAERLSSPGELALLAAQAERRGDRTLALQIGKIAHARGLEVDTVSWPVGAIPPDTRIGETGRALAYAIARQESAFNAAAVSPANARGLLQLLPGTAKLMAKKTGLKYDKGRLTRDAAYNATLGSAYLSEQLDNFGNSYILTFAGYNAGPGRAREWVAAYGDPTGKSIEDVVDWVERIPFTETRNYVQRVMENYQIYKARIGSGRLDIVSDLRFGRR